MITFEQYSKAFYDGYHVKGDELKGITSQGRCKIEFDKINQVKDVDSEYIKGWSDGIAYANSSAILKDFIEYLHDRHFVDDDVWQENDIVKEFLNEKK